MSEFVWYHGGPKIRGNWITPPSVRKAESTRDWALEMGAPPEVVERQTRPDRVFVTRDRGAALLFASAHPEPYLYMVEPHGELEEDPDLLRVGGGPRVATDLSKMCLRAHILARVPVPPAMAARARAAALSGGAR